VSEPAREPDGRNYLDLPTVIMLIMLGMALYAGYWLLFGFET
jgi:hypothetical protein